MRLDNSTEESILSFLYDSGIITKDQQQNIRDISSESGAGYIQTVFSMGLTSEQDLLNLLSTNFSLPIIELSSYKYTDDLNLILSKKYSLGNFISPFEVNDSVIKVAISDPSKLSLINNLKNLTKKEIEIYATSLSSNYNYLNDETVSFKQSAKKIQKNNTQTNVSKSQSSSDIEYSKNQEELITFVDKIIIKSFEVNASDIHIEPYLNFSKVRFRIDGLLNNNEEFSKFLHQNFSAVITRIKILAKLDIAERRLPQDGAIKFLSNNIDIDLRVSTLPTGYGERVVMRLLRKDSGEKKLKDLISDEKSLSILQKNINSSQGMILVTGPTGSGKTTTLYSILKEISSPSKNILTAEDPIEYDMEGIGQVSIKEEIGLTFAQTLRSFLRQDPEVILVGEIRDKETVDIALKASLTGHLVFSTIHTNDAISTITRLINMGTPDYLIAAALSLVVAQRLARKNCSLCSVEDIDAMKNSKLLRSLGLTSEKASRAVIYKGKGCSPNTSGGCGGSGYKGRIGIYEILEIGKELKSAILSGMSQTELKSLSQKNGFISMQESAHELLLSGELSVEEFQRVFSF